MGTPRFPRIASGLVLGLALAGTFTALVAQEKKATPIKIAVVDTEKILLRSQAGKNAVIALKKRQEQSEVELRAKQEEIKRLQDQISEGRLTLSQDRLTDMQKQLEDKLVALRRLQDDANRDLTKLRDTMLGGLDERVMPVVNQTGKELHFTAIFRKFESGLIYADEGVDITDLIIQRMDSGIGSKGTP